MQFTVIITFGSVMRDGVSETGALSHCHLQLRLLPATKMAMVLKI